MVLPCRGLAKQTKPGKESSLQPVMVASFEEAGLCPVACLQSYERATAGMREEECWQLFLGITSPHKPVTSSTIARWLKSTLKVVGLGEHFSAHSVRSAASTAAAMSDVSTKEIMSRAGWSNSETFCKFYFRPQPGFCAAKNFGRAVLN